MAEAAAVEKARQIQFNEYERRLDGLNHAHEQAIETQRLTVPRETFENYVKESKNALDVALRNASDIQERRTVEVDRRLVLLEKNDDRGTGKTEGSAATVRWIFLTISALGTIILAAIAIIKLIP